MFNAGFAETGETDEQAVTTPLGTSDAKFASGLLPVDWKPSRQTPPIFNYPYARTREAPHVTARAGDPDPCHGYKLRYVNPASGGAPIATMGTFMHRRRASQRRPIAAPTARSSRWSKARARAGSATQVMRWKKRDHFAVPSWAKRRASRRQRRRAVFLSDRPIQEKLDLWREDRGGK